MSAGADPSICMACRGTGKVVSGLGGTPHEVVCPWCEGTGHRIGGIDAQEHPSEGGDPGTDDHGSGDPGTNDHGSGDPGTNDHGSGDPGTDDGGADVAPADGEAVEENAASEGDLS